MVPKNSPLMKVFLEYVAQKAIPPAATEVFGDLATQFYEGCIILRILDHRTLNNDAAGTAPKQENENGLKPEGSEGNVGAEPKSYTTILRPTPLSMWHDLLYATDPHEWFSDQLALNIESELLKFSVRNIDLRVPDAPLLKPQLQTGIKRSSSEPISRKDVKKFFTYRPEVPHKPRGLREDVAQRGSEYEQLMSVMYESPTQPSGQFMRLSFIENLRKKQKAARIASMQNQMAQQQGGGAALQSPLDSQNLQQQSIFGQGAFSNDSSAPGSQQTNRQRPFDGQKMQQGSPQVQQMNNSAATPDNNNFNQGAMPASSPPVSGDTKTLGKATKPRGKTSTARGGNSSRGRGASKAAARSPNVGGKTVPGGANGGGQNSNGWDNNNMGRTTSGKSLPGKTVPGKTVPGKGMSGKTIPGKTIPGKTIPGNANRGKGQK